MKKEYICPKSEVIHIECDNMLLSASTDAVSESKVMLDGDTETDEQW